MRLPSLLVALCSLSLVPPALAKSATPEAATAPGAPAGLGAEIELRGLEQLLAKYKGRPILVNVLASWCDACKRELPDIAKLMKKRPKLVVIGVDVDEKAADAVAFVGKVPKGITLVWRHDGVEPLLGAFKLPQDWNEAVPPGWTKNIPLSFVFNKKGSFETGAVGQLTPEALQEIEKIAR